jgi:hypothetical protein
VSVSRSLLPLRWLSDIDGFVGHRGYRCGKSRDNGSENRSGVSSSVLT